MDFTESRIFNISSLFILMFFCVWGGVVHFLMEVKGKRKIKWKGLIYQIIISGFTGSLGGLYSFEKGYSISMTMAIAGVCSAIGGPLLHTIWNRFLSVKGE